MNEYDIFNDEQPHEDMQTNESAENTDAVDESVTTEEAEVIVVGEPSQAEESTEENECSQDENVAADEELPQDNEPHTESEPVITIDEPEKDKKRLPGWAIALIVVGGVALAFMIICALNFTMQITRRVISNNRNTITPGGNITFSSETPAEDTARGALMSVVNIENSSNMGGFFGYNLNQGAGSGVVIREDGYILTSLQLAENDGNITVKLQDGKKYSAQAVTADSINGFALLKIDAVGLTPITIGDSSAVSVGNRVAVIGNTINSNLTNPVTLGYVCGVDNSVPLDNGNYVNLFQVDASTIADSVGGILLNEKGELIGMASGMISNSSSEIGLVTPINDLSKLLGDIVDVSTQTTASGLTIGFSGSDESHGVLVTMVGEGTPAEKAGLLVDDLIVKVDGEAVTSIKQINEIKARHVKGDTIVLTVYRDGEMHEINAILE